MIQFTIDHKITAKDGLNRFWQGSHWTYRKKWADYWHLLVKSSLQGIPKRTFNKPVLIEMHFKSNLDVDGHAAMAKVIIDSLVREGWLINDNQKHVKSLIMTASKKLEGCSIFVKVVEL